MNIMLIDDDEASHILNKVSISDAGVDLNNVNSYYTVDSAILELKSINSNNKKCDWPDFIFLDINMPQKNGYDFIEEFEQINSEFSLPRIYFVSSSINPRDLERAKELKIIHGFKSKFLEKGFIESLSSLNYKHLS